jgi:hypothetical protein
VNYLAASCTESQWFEREAPLGLQGLSTIERFTLDLGSTYILCVRAYDIVGNISSGTCSDGQRVRPSEVEIEQNRQSRDALGLNANASAIENLLTDPPVDGVSDAYGLTTTLQEAASLQSLFAVQDAAATLVDNFETALPNVSGGSYIDENGNVIINIARPAPTQVGRLLGRVKASCRNAVVRTRKARNHVTRGRRKAKAPRCSSNIQLRRVRYTNRVLEYLQHRIVDQDSNAITKVGINVIGASVDPELNRLVVEVDEDSSRSAVSAARWLNHYYTRFRRDKTGPIAVVIGEPMQALVSADPPHPRTTRTNFFRQRGVLTGGIALTIGQENQSRFGWCSSGFFFNDENERVMITADHCFEFGLTARASGQKVGRGYSVPEGKQADLRIARLENDVQGDSSVFRRYQAPVIGPPSPLASVRPILELGTTNSAGKRIFPVRPARGTWVCRSAISDGTFTRTGQSCTTVVNRGTMYHLEGYEYNFTGDTLGPREIAEDRPYPDNIKENARFKGCQADSGGPIYRLIGPFNQPVGVPIGLISAGKGTIKDVHPADFPRADCHRTIVYAPIVLADR